MRSCAGCKNVKCRCADCYALVEVDGKWFCDIAEQFCKSIEYCEEYEFVLVEDGACKEV